MTPPKKGTAPDLAPATLSESRGIRYLHLDTPWVQGAMRKSKPQALELEYVQRMMAWMLLRDPDEVTRGHAVQLGLGAGSITRFCHDVLRMRTTAVEINPSVIDACRLWFHLPDNGRRLQVLLEDAAHYAADPAHAGTADVLCVDLYDHDAAAPVLDDDAFYQACCRLLAPQGVMSVNLFGRNAGFAVSAARIQRAFGPDRVATLRPTREGNAIVLALKGVDLPSHDELLRRASQLETRFAQPDLPARKWLDLLQPLPAPAASPDPL